MNATAAAVSENATRGCPPEIKPVSPEATRIAIPAMETARPATMVNPSLSFDSMRWAKTAVHTGTRAITIPTNPAEAYWSATVIMT